MLFGYNVGMNSPKEIASNYLGIAKSKTSFSWHKILLLGVLAGMFIALAGVFSSFAGTGLDGAQGRLVRGAVFPLGLILVVLCGAELFTGNCLLVAPALSREIKVKGLLKNWGLAYLGNFIGSVLVALLVSLCFSADDPTAITTVATAAAKCDASFGVTFVKGILCNILVCLSVWAAMASKSAAGKILAVFMPIFAFVSCGFEHSIADMYYITSGLMTSVFLGMPVDALNFGNGLLYCLLPSTLGNIVGGGLLAVLFWAVFFEHKKTEPVAPQDDTK